MELNKKYTEAYARRMFKHATGSSEDQGLYDRAAKHLSSKFPEASREDIHKELNKHFPAYQTEGLGADLITGTKKAKNALHKFISTGFGEIFRRKLMMTNSGKGRAPNPKKTKSNESMSIFNQERKEYFLEHLQESMGLHGIISDRANALSGVMNLPPQAIVPQLKALLARKAQQNKKLKESFREFIAEYESVLAENGIEEYDLDEATEYFIEEILPQRQEKIIKEEIEASLFSLLSESTSEEFCDKISDILLDEGIHGDIHKGLVGGVQQALQNHAAMLKKHPNNPYHQEVREAGERVRRAVDEVSDHLAKSGYNPQKRKTSDTAQAA